MGCRLEPILRGLAWNEGRGEDWIRGAGRGDREQGGEQRQGHGAETSAVVPVFRERWARFQEGLLLPPTADPPHTRQQPPPRPAKEKASSPRV